MEIVEKAMLAYLAIGLSSAVVATFLVLIPSLKATKPRSTVFVLYTILYIVGMVFLYPTIIDSILRDTKNSIGSTVDSIRRVMAQCY